jgi:hypothetical protein
MQPIFAPDTYGRPAKLYRGGEVFRWIVRNVHTFTPGGASLFLHSQKGSRVRLVKANTPPAGKNLKVDPSVEL